MLSISKLSKTSKIIYRFLKIKLIYTFSSSNQKILSENLSELSLENPHPKFDYDENVKKLTEISKIVFPNVNQFSLKRQKQIFYTFTPYQMMDPIAYKSIEKNLMKSFNEMEFEEVIKFLKCLSLSKNLTISPTIFLLIEHRIMKNLSIMKQCNVKSMVDLCEGLFNKLLGNLESLNLNHLVLVYFLFFSEFLQKNMLDPLTLENNNKFQIKENINQILLTGQSSNNNNESKISSFVCNPQENYDTNKQSLEQKIEKLIESEKKCLKLNDIFIFFDCFLFLERKLPEKLEKAIIKSISEINFGMTPNEIFKLIEILNDKRLKSTKNMSIQIINYVYSYFDKFMNELSSFEICEIWKYVDFYNLGSFKIKFCNFSLCF